MTHRPARLGASLASSGAVTLLASTVVDSEIHAVSLVVSALALVWLAYRSPLEVAAMFPWVAIASIAGVLATLLLGSSSRSTESCSNPEDLAVLRDCTTETTVSIDEVAIVVCLALLVIGSVASIVSIVGWRRIWPPAGEWRVAVLDRAWVVACGFLLLLASESVDSERAVGGTAVRRGALESRVQSTDGVRLSGFLADVATWWMVVGGIWLSLSLVRRSRGRPPTPNLAP